MEGDEWKPGDRFTVAGVGPVRVVRESRGLENSTAVALVAQRIDKCVVSGSPGFSGSEFDRGVQNGYCYLKMIKLELREQLANRLGSFPMWNEVLDVPVDYWDVSAIVKLAVREVTDGRYHIEEFCGIVNQVPLQMVVVGFRQKWDNFIAKSAFMLSRVGGIPLGDTEVLLAERLYGDNHLVVIKGQSHLDNGYVTFVDGCTDVIAVDNVVDLSKYRFLVKHMAFVPGNSVLHMVGMQSITVPGTGLFLSIDGIARARVTGVEGLRFVAIAMDSDAEFLVDRVQYIQSTIEESARRTRCFGKDIYLVSDDLISKAVGPWNSYHFDMTGFIGVSDMPQLVYNAPCIVPNDVVVTFNAAAPCWSSFDVEPKEVIVCVGDAGAVSTVCDTSYHHLGVDLHDFSEPMVAMLPAGTIVGAGVRVCRIRDPTALLLRGKSPLLKVVSDKHVVFRPMRCYRHCAWYAKVKVFLPVGWYRRVGIVWSTVNFSTSLDGNDRFGVDRSLFGSIGKYGFSKFAIDVHA